MVEKNKDMVRRMVEAINEGREDEAVAGLFAPRAARRVGRLFAEFRSAFPDWHEEIVQLVGEGDMVAGRFSARVHTWESSWARPPQVGAWRLRRSSSCGRRGTDSRSSGG